VHEVTCGTGDALAGRTVLVTGAGGFIGGHVARRLVALGARVRALVRSPAVDAGPSDASLSTVSGDVLSPSALRLAAEGADFVVHAAATTRLARRDTLRRTTVEGTRHVHEAAMQAGCGRFVFLSSFSVYIGTRDRAYDEDTRVTPSGDAYGDAKIEAEAGLSRAGPAGPRVFILRAPIVFGRGSRFWSTRFFDTARRRRLLLPGSGRFEMAVVYVDNLVDAVCACLTEPAEAGVYNVFDHKIRYREFVEPYARAWGRSLLPVPCWMLATGARSGDALLRAMGLWLPISARQFEFLTQGGTARCRAPDKARHALSWLPRVPFERAVADTLQGMRQDWALRRTR
jgi:nucleoside-diphosphate-sugar epimerase